MAVSVPDARSTVAGEGHLREVGSPRVSGQHALTFRDFYSVIPEVTMLRSLVVLGSRSSRIASLLLRFRLSTGVRRSGMSRLPAGARARERWWRAAVSALESAVATMARTVDRSTLLGSMTRQCAHHARFPVVIVRVGSSSASASLVAVGESVA